MERSPKLISFTDIETYVQRNMIPVFETDSVEELTSRRFDSPYSQIVVLVSAKIRTEIISNYGLGDITWDDVYAGYLGRILGMPIYSRKEYFPNKKFNVYELPFDLDINWSNKHPILDVL